MDLKLLQQGVAEIRKTYGETSVFRANEEGVTYKVDAIPTGSFNIDDAIGVGGVPRGRLIMLSGGESSGKSLLALSVIKEAQKQGGIGYYIDAEHTLTVKWMKSQGIDPEGVLVSQEDDAEKAFELLLGQPATKNRSKPVLGVLQNEKILEAGLNKGVIVIDSLSQLVPPIERQAQLGDHTMAAMARFLTPTLRRLTPQLHNTGVVCIVILQMRLDPGQMFGDPRKVSGGQALKHSASVWLDVAKVSRTEIEKDGEPVGHTIKLKVKKNKVGVPFKEAETVIHYTRGIDLRSELAAQAIKRGVIVHPPGSSDNSNTWTHPTMGQVIGLPKVLEAIEENKKLAKELHQQIVAHVRKEQAGKEEKTLEFAEDIETSEADGWDGAEDEVINIGDALKSAGQELEALSVMRLKDMAQERQVKGRHTMSKAELVEVLTPIIQQERKKIQETGSQPSNGQQSETAENSEDILKEGGSQKSEQTDDNSGKRPHIVNGNSQDTPEKTEVSTGAE